MKDRTILVSAVIAGIIHALILFVNLGMTPPTLASAPASIEVNLVAAPVAPAPAPASPAAPKQTEPVVESEPVIEPTPIPEPKPTPEPTPEPEQVVKPTPIPEPEPEPIPEPVIEPEPEPEPAIVVERPHETRAVEVPAKAVSTASAAVDAAGYVSEEHAETDIDDAGEAGASAEKAVPTFDREPGYAYNPKPAYPRAARRHGQQGTVILLVEVRANGRVGAIEIEETSGYELLDKSAVKAVRRWRFVPAKKAGVPVGARVRIPVEFNLEGER